MPDVQPSVEQPTYTERCIDAIRECSGRMYAASVYASALRSMHRGEVIDWPALNAAVAEKWSEAGLAFVKREAWKLA